jgi:uncharacterized protein YegJ (DUF2314 family)
MKLASLLVLSVFVMAACAKEDGPQPVTQREGEPVVTGFQAEDQEMNAAMRNARDTLAEVEARLSKPPATQQHIGLKGRFAEDGNVEHMWVDDIEITAEGYRGKLGNHPVDIQSIDVGSEVLVKRENVSDWMAIDDGKLVGGFTLRVQRGRMTPEQRADFDASADFAIED